MSCFRLLSITSDETHNGKTLTAYFASFKSHFSTDRLWAIILNYWSLLAPVCTSRRKHLNKQSLEVFTYVKKADSPAVKPLKSLSWAQLAHFGFCLFIFLAEKYITCLNSCLKAAVCFSVILQLKLCHPTRPRRASDDPLKVAAADSSITVCNMLSCRRGRLELNRSAIDFWPRQATTSHAYWVSTCSPSYKKTPLIHST